MCYGEGSIVESLSWSKEGGSEVLRKWYRNVVLVKEECFRCATETVA